MPYGDDHFANILRCLELAIADVDETWRDRWSTMDTSERMHFLNVELLDVERYLRELSLARDERALSPAQAARLDTVAAAWKRAGADTIAEMARSVEQARRQGAA